MSQVQSVFNSWHKRWLVRRGMIRGYYACIFLSLIIFNVIALQANFSTKWANLFWVLISVLLILIKIHPLRKRMVAAAHELAILLLKHRLYSKIRAVYAAIQPNGAIITAYIQHVRQLDSNDDVLLEALRHLKWLASHRFFRLRQCFVGLLAGAQTVTFVALFLLLGMIAHVFQPINAIEQWLKGMHIGHPLELLFLLAWLGALFWGICQYVLEVWLVRRVMQQVRPLAEQFYTAAIMHAADPELPQMQLLMRWVSPSFQLVERAVAQRLWTLAYAFLEARLTLGRCWVRIASNLGLYLLALSLLAYWLGAAINYEFDDVILAKLSISAAVGVLAIVLILSGWLSKRGLVKRHEKDVMQSIFENKGNVRAKQISQEMRYDLDDS